MELRPQTLSYFDSIINVSCIMNGTSLIHELFKYVHVYIPTYLPNYLSIHLSSMFLSFSVPISTYINQFLHIFGESDIYIVTI